MNLGFRAGNLPISLELDKVVNPALQRIEHAAKREQLQILFLRLTLPYELPKHCGAIRRIKI